MLETRWETMDGNEENPEYESLSDNEDTNSLYFNMVLCFRERLWMDMNELNPPHLEMVYQLHKYVSNLLLVLVVELAGSAASSAVV